MLLNLVGNFGRIMKTPKCPKVLVIELMLKTVFMRLKKTIEKGLPGLTEFLGEKVCYNCRLTISLSPISPFSKVFLSLLKLTL